jgi:TPR repeat protein
MRMSAAAALAAVLLAALGVSAPSVAQSLAPTQLAQAVSGEEANRRGDAAYDRKDYAEAMRWYRLSAKEGYALGEANIGFLYAKGLGVKQDFKESVRWYLRAAEKGQIEAQHNLALKYFNGQGVAKDEAQARYWMEKSAAGGDADAKQWLADHPQ